MILKFLMITRVPFVHQECDFCDSVKGGREYDFGASLGLEKMDPSSSSFGTGALEIRKRQLKVPADMTE
jgi:hypothetical protein